MVFVNLILTFFLISDLHALSLPRFLTKQSPEAIRLISTDGRYYYIQKKGGILTFSTEFRSQEILVLDKNISFSLISSLDKKRIVIEAINSRYSYLNQKTDSDLYVVDYGGTKPEKISSGRYPRLFLNDQWIGAYKPYDKKIALIQIDSKKEILIPVDLGTNPFFIPDFWMPNPEHIIFTEINEKGFPKITLYHLLSKQRKVLFQSRNVGDRLEVCANQTHLFWGIFAHDGFSTPSSISSIPLEKNPNYQFNVVYQSHDPDIGNMICTPDSIFFIKTLKSDTETGARQTEAAKLELKSKKVTTLTNYQRVTQIFNMDGRILLPWQGDLFVLEGSYDLSQDVLERVDIKKMESGDE